MHLRPWQAAFRVGIAPQLSTDGLQALADALERDNPQLIQCVSSQPVPTNSGATDDWPVNAACAVNFPGWQGDGLATVGELEVHYSRTIRGCHERAGKRAFEDFLAWYDAADRDVMRELLLDEVREELYRRRFGRAMVAGCDLAVRA